MLRSRNQLLSRLILALAAIGSSTVWPATGLRAEDDNPQGVSASIQSLAAAMDQFHGRFPVYDDISSAGNHFHALAKFPSDSAAVTINGSYSLDRHSGATAMRATFTPGGVNFGGFVFQNGLLPDGAAAPILNFGTAPGAGYDLSGATSLTFWARGEQGGEAVDFFMGGVGWNGAFVNNPCTPSHPAQCPYPDSTPAVKITVSLTTEWTPYTIDLTARDLSYVLGGFGWGVNGALNPGGATFLVDDVQYNLTPERRNLRLNEPRFVRSFTTLPVQPDPHDLNQDDDIDLVLRNAAFVYDNALALLAFLADGTTDSVRRARLIGDAIVYATAHDRFFDDGRLRSAYAAGDIALPPGWTPNGRAGTVPVAGFYEDAPMLFSELREARTFDTGNQAWVMIALLALHQRTADVRYLNASLSLGTLINTFRNDSGAYQGFLGGLDYVNGDSSAPVTRVYASAEHNLDVYAAFVRLFSVTGDPAWQSGAQHARQFVDDMWDMGSNCYWAGVLDSATRNTSYSQLPLDVQAWSVLALPDTLTQHPLVLACAEVNHLGAANGFAGFDFNTDRDGVWFEGTAQMATAYAWAGQPSSADFYRGELRRAQTTTPFGDGAGIAAASADAVTTGFDFKLFRRLHIGATAWNVFAQLGFNPFYQILAAGPPTLSLITPAVASQGESLSVILKGSNFDASLTIDAGAGVSVSTLVTLDPTTAVATLTVAANATVGGRPLTVTTWGGGMSNALLFTINLPTLVITRTGSGTGHVSSGPGGIDCGLSCAWSFTHGQAVVLTALPGPGSVFVRWTGDADCLDGHVTMSATRHCVARFDSPRTSLTSLIADLDGDGKSDLVLQHTDGSTALWLMNGVTVTSGVILIGPGTGWHVRHVGDFDGDGKSDLVLQHTDGRTAIWLMNGLSIGSGVMLIGPDTGWSAREIGDFDGDGKSDIVLHNHDGRMAVWLMNGTSVIGGAFLIGPGTGWSTKATGDFDGDGKDDIALEHTDGRLALWLMTGLAVRDGAIVIGAASAWHLAQTGDFDGDGRTDIVLQHADGSTAVWLMQGVGVKNGAVLIGPSTGWSSREIGDVDGDGKDDIVWGHVDGSTAVWLMNGVAVSHGAVLIGPATGWTSRDVGDFDGDGHTDIVWQHTDGSAAIWLMRGVSVNGGGFLFGPGSGWSPAG